MWEASRASLDHGHTNGRSHADAKMTTPTSIAAATLDAFSDRLERIELKLSGRITQPDALEPSKDTRTRSKPTVIEQLAKVQKSIQDLLARSECSRDWLMLRPYLHGK